MHVRTLVLADFRSYAEANLELTPGATTILGDNGQGKTNLVEALAVASTLGSHRVATTVPLVRAGAEHAIVRVAVVRDGRTLLVELEVRPGKALRARLNRAPVPRAREVLGVLRTVVFAPEDLAVVKGDPAERRRFLDDLLVARAPRFAGVRADYDRVLRQRNALLRSAAGARRGADLSTLDTWDSHLARTGAELLAGRLDLLDGLRPLLAKAYDALAGGRGPAGADYRCSADRAPVDGITNGRTTAGLDGAVRDPAGSAEELAAGSVVAVGPDQVRLQAALSAALAGSRPAELERGTTLVGPHRDDLELRIGDLPTRGYASHGESWSMAVALRLAGYELLRADGIEPVLVLDDVFAELDDDRRGRLADLLVHAEQVLVTAAVAADVPAPLAEVRYLVADGQVRRA